MNLNVADFPQDVLDKMMEALLTGDIAFIKFEKTARGIFLGVVTAAELFKEPHCKTCQCNRVDAEMPLDQAGKSRKRSWHQD